MGRTLIKYGKKETYIDNMLLRKLDNVKKIIKKNWDCVILIDGMERSGKSTLGFICAWYLAEGKLTYDNIASDSEDALKKCESLPDGSVLILDEGSLIFSSRDTMKKEQRQLVKVMNVIGQKNMVFIIILPTFFDLIKYVAVMRSRFLLHTYTSNKLERGRFCFFGEKKKKILYEYGKKHYNSYKFPKANWVGMFWNFFPFDNYEDYKKVKQKSLFDAFHKQAENKEKEIRDVQIRYLKSFVNLLKKKGFEVTNKELSKELGIGNRTFYNYMREGSVVQAQNEA